MSIKVSVKDYQIIKKAEAEFIPGLNIIIGPSNNGKTSFIKAIKALLYTESGTTPIRSGQNAYTVGMNINNHNIILQKGLKDSAYLVDGVKFSKYGTNTPEEVSDALGIKEIILNGNKEQLNFWNQMDYPFLLDRSSTDLFRFIIDSGDNDKVSLALKDMVKDRQTLEGNIKQYQSNILMLDSQIEDLKAKTNDSDNIITACDDIINLEPRIKALKDLETLKQSIITSQTKFESLTSTLNSVSSKDNMINDFLNAIGESNNLLVHNLNIKHTISNLELNLDTLKTNLTKLQKLPKIEISSASYDKLLELKINLIRIKTKLDNTNTYNLKEMVWSDSKFDLNQLQFIKSNLENYDYKLGLLTQRISSIENESNNVLDILNHIDVCPLCGNKISFKEEN